MVKPTKEQVRDYQAKRLAEHSPPPTPEQVRRELGWDLVEARRKEQKPSYPDAVDITIGFIILLLLWPAFAWPAPADQYRAQITREAQFRFGIPAPAPAIAGQIQQESAWNPLARSRVGASGLMQFMPSTAQWVSTAGAFGTVDPLNPSWSIRAGVWYDRWLYERVRQFDSECDRWLFALSSYNGGLGYTYKRQKLSEKPGSYQFTGYLNPGITAPNQHENESYGPRILQRHQPAFRTWGRVVCIP